MKKSFLGKKEESLLRSREILVWGQIVLAFAFIVSSFSGCVDSNSINNFSRQQLSVVQLCDGSSLYAQQRFTIDREPEVVQNFAQQATSLFWTWDGTYPGRVDERGKPVDDKGMKAENGYLVPVNAWAASLMIKPTLATSLLNELSDPQNKKIPPGYFKGNFTTTLKIRYISEPVEVKTGIWDVSLVSDRLVFDRHNNQQMKPIGFNKTLRIRAIPIVHSPLKENADGLDKALYAMNANGLEIIGMFDYKP